MDAPGRSVIDGIDRRSSDGREQCGSTGRALDRAALHDNGVETIDHLVILSPDVDRTIEALAAVGVEPRATRQVDAEQYGFEARQTFFRMGEVILELIGPNEPMDGAADRPAGFFGLAYTVRDLDATAALLADHIGRVKDAVQPGRRITTLRHKDLGMSVATAFMSRGAGAI